MKYKFNIRVFILDQDRQRRDLTVAIPSDTPVCSVWEACREELRLRVAGTTILTGIQFFAREGQGW